MIENKYYHSLDLFRGFCGYGVAICHFYAFIFGNQFMEYLSIIFVEFFFVLSGFVLYPQLLKVIDNKKNLIIFYKRRWIRTLPLYFVILLLVTILTSQFLNKESLKYLFLIQKLIPNFIDNDYYPVAWSLSIEEFFYLLFPFILIFLNRKNFLKISVLFFILITTTKYILVDNFDANYYRTGTLLRFDAILLGFIISHFKDVFIKYRNSIIILSFFSLSAFLYFFEYFTVNKEIPDNRFLFIFLMQFISVLILFSFVLMNSLFKNPKLKKFSLLISQQTYSIYLFHIIIIYIFDKIDFTSYIILPIYVFLLFLFSTLIYNFFEKPLLKLRPKIID